MIRKVLKEVKGTMDCMNQLEPICTTRGCVVLGMKTTSNAIQIIYDN